MLHGTARVTGAAIGLFLASATMVAGQAPAPLTAAADLRDGAGRQVAVADLRESQNQVLVTLTFPAQAPLTGTHAIHIHERGSCTPPDFNDSGAIFNPLGRQHRLRNPDGPMVGDVADLTLGPQGLERYSITAQLATLSPGRASLLGQGGTTLMIDANTDDNTSQPSGNSGAHIACGDAWFEQDIAIGGSRPSQSRSVWCSPRPPLVRHSRRATAPISPGQLATSGRSLAAISATGAIRRSTRSTRRMFRI
jgi:Cu-Zn family superoxide dismutase